MSMSKFNAGDKVKILDGSKITNYIGGWVDSIMKMYVGKTVTVRSAHYEPWRGWYYFLELPGLCYGCKWDERGLEKACRTKDGADQKIVIYRSAQSVIAKDYSTGKTAEAMCSPADEFDFHTGAKLAFTRLVDPDREAKPNEPEKPKCKFKCGDKIIGNAKANRYGVTVEGWKGEVSGVVVSTGEMLVRPHGNKSCGYTVDPECFDLDTEPEYYTGKVVCVKAHFTDMWTPGKVYTVIDGKTHDDYGAVRDEITSPAQMSSVTDPRNEFIEYKGGA